MINGKASFKAFCLYQLGKKNGRRVMAKLKKKRKPASMNVALTEEMDARQESFPAAFVQLVNSQDYASKLWQVYERGVKESVLQILERSNQHAK